MDNRESALESSEYSEYGFLVPFLQKGIEVGGGGGGKSTRDKVVENVPLSLPQFLCNILRGMASGVKSFLKAHKTL